MSERDKQRRKRFTTVAIDLDSYNRLLTIKKNYHFRNLNDVIKYLINRCSERGEFERELVNSRDKVNDVLHEGVNKGLIKETSIFTIMLYIEKWCREFKGATSPAGVLKYFQRVVGRLDLEVERAFQILQEKYPETEIRCADWLK